MTIYGENPNPITEKIQIGLANNIYNQREIEYWLTRNEQESKNLEKIARKRVIPDEIYQNFYNQASNAKLNSNFSEDWREKAGIIMRYFSGTKISKNINKFIQENDYVKIGALFNKLLKYSEKRIEQ